MNWRFASVLISLLFIGLCIATPKNSTNQETHKRNRITLVDSDIKPSHNLFNTFMKAGLDIKNTPDGEKREQLKDAEKLIKEIQKQSNDEPNKSSIKIAGDNVIKKLPPNVTNSLPEVPEDTDEKIKEIAEVIEDIMIKFPDVNSRNGSLLVNPNKTENSSKNPQILQIFKDLLTKYEDSNKTEKAEIIHAIISAYAKIDDILSRIKDDETRGRVYKDIERELRHLLDNDNLHDAKKISKDIDNVLNKIMHNEFGNCPDISLYKPQFKFTPEDSFTILKQDILNKSVNDECYKSYELLHGKYSTPNISYTVTASSINGITPKEPDFYTIYVPVKICDNEHDNCYEEKLSIKLNIQNESKSQNVRKYVVCAILLIVSLLLIISMYFCMKKVIVSREEVITDKDQDQFEGVENQETEDTSFTEVDV